ncbi:MAG: FISUMP domain-containing protein, partial [Flavobacteriales bacterium]|nr:FISUMP domain-containing protein [Flavobacteriales bacterium]
WYRRLNTVNDVVNRAFENNRALGFSIRCLQGEIMVGCTDSDACNYNATANLDDSSCTYATTWYIDADGDGLGESGTSQSACNQPNGFVADSSDNCDNMTATNYNDAGNVACEYPVCGTPVVTFDNHDYTTIAIGDDCWFAENLRTTIYEDGSPVLYSNYNDDPANVDTYGRLYNWHHHTSLNNLCPTGWHVSAFDEWETMINHLGGTTDAGGELKESGTTHWSDPNTLATNESGFTALPGGSLDSDGNFSGLGTVAHFWTSISVSPVLAMSYKLNHDSGDASPAMVFQYSNRCSVRCVED